MEFGAAVADCYVDILGIVPQLTTIKASLVGTLTFATGKGKWYRQTILVFVAAVDPAWPSWQEMSPSDAFVVDSYDYADSGSSEHPSCLSRVLQTASFLGFS